MWGGEEGGERDGANETIHKRATLQFLTSFNIRESFRTFAQKPPAEIRTSWCGVGFSVPHRMISPQSRSSDFARTARTVFTPPLAVDECFCDFRLEYATRRGLFIQLCLVSACVRMRRARRNSLHSSRSRDLSRRPVEQRRVAIGQPEEQPVPRRRYISLFDLLAINRTSFSAREWHLLAQEGALVAQFYGRESR